MTENEAARRDAPPDTKPAPAIHHDDPLIEECARALCRSSGSDCIGGVSCAPASKCDSWPGWVGAVETVLRVVKRQHLIEPKQRAARRDAPNVEEPQNG